MLRKLLQRRRLALQARWAQWESRRKKKKGREEWMRAR